jgi:hypothetical protein
MISVFLCAIFFFLGFWFARKNPNTHISWFKEEITNKDHDLNKYNDNEIM